MEINPFIYIRYIALLRESKVGKNMKNAIKLFTVLLLTVFTVHICYAGVMVKEIGARGIIPADYSNYIVKPHANGNNGMICLNGVCAHPTVVLSGIPDNYNIRLHSDKLFQSYVSDIILHEVDSSELLDHKKAAAYAADYDDEKINDTAAYQNRKDGSIVILKRTN